MSLDSVDVKEYRRLALGSCPDSWGVWFADDPLQTPWTRFLDELASVGYEWLELGPYGYLPTDPEKLRDEIGRRGLRVSGGTVDGFGRLHDKADFPKIAERTLAVAHLTRSQGADNVIFVPTPGYRDDVTGAFREPRELSEDGWKTLVESANELGKMVREETGARLHYHPHVDAYVENQQQIERFLEETNPEYVSLCLDTGHIAFRHGDNVQLIKRFPDRIGYVHIKQMNPEVIAATERDDLPFGQAVKLGASVEAPLGVPAIVPILDALSEVDAEFFCIVEQDMYPCDFDAPRPAAQRTRDYLAGVGLGGSR